MRFRLTVRVCAALVATIGLVALLGWALGRPFLASLGGSRIPVAPSTAVMFMLYAAAVVLRTLPRRGTYWAGLSLSAGGALVAALLFMLSFQGIYSEAEHAGIKIEHKAGETPAGHMSPVTALCFLLAALSYLASLSSGKRPWQAFAAWVLAALLITTGFLLVLAYLYGTPFLYGSGFIPPAALTSTAFIALGIALIFLASPHARPLFRGQDESIARTSYTFLLIFILLAAGIVTAGFLHYRSYEMRYRAEVEHQLSAIAGLKADELVQWRKERLGDASVFYKNINFSERVRRYLDNPEDAENRERLRTWLRQVQEGYQHDRVFLLDAHGRERMSVPEARQPASRHVSLRAAEVLRTKQMVLEDFYRNEFDQRVYLAVLVPIFDERGAGCTLGTLVMRIDPEQYLYPLLKRWPTPSRTAETLLVRRDGNAALFLNELRFRKDAALNLRVSLEQKELPAVQAVLGREGIVEGRDYRGIPAIADVRAVPGSPWFLVARMDLAEVYEAVRERLWIMVVLIGALLAGSGAGMWLIWRRQSDQYYRERCEAAEALRESEERLHMLIEGVKDHAIYLLDAEGNVMSWNTGAERLKGYRGDEIIGRDYSIFFTPEELQNDKPRRLLETARSVGRVEEEDWRVRKDGSRFWADAIITALHDQDGRLRGFAKITRDITERKLREEELKQKNAELERFIYTISHDLKSPLVTVKTFIGFLEQDLSQGDPGKIEKDIFYVRSATDKMGQLLDELLEMSRVGRVVNPPVDVTFRELVDEALKVVAGRIAERGVEVRVTDETITLRGDRPRLAEIWQNLVENAVKFMGDQPAPLVEIGAERKDRDTVFYVRDNGMGIDPRYREKVFGLFEKLNPKSEGTGLGLALVKRIVDLYGGSISLEPRGQGQGACFRFTLPGAVENRGGEKS